ncbi:MAG: hypothetical protein HY866_07570 [Chloroflexi bacterium]|nr:hypothetical protein [Chloroflexota bacterium]
MSKQVVVIDNDPENRELLILASGIFISIILVAAFLLLFATPVEAAPLAGGPIMCSGVVRGDGHVTPGNGTVHIQLNHAPDTDYQVAACAGPFELSGELTVEATVSFPNDAVEGSTGFGMQNNWFEDPNWIYALQGIWFYQIGGAGNQVFASVMMPGLGQMDSVPITVANPKSWNDYKIVVSEDSPGQSVAHFFVNDVEVAAITLAAAPSLVRVELWNDNQQAGQDLVPYLVTIGQMQQVKAKRVIAVQQ